MPLPLLFLLLSGVVCFFGSYALIKLSVVKNSKLLTVWCILGEGIGVLIIVIALFVWGVIR